MQIRVLRPGLDDRLCTECDAGAEVELERYDAPDRLEALCLGCLILQLLWLRGLFATRREPVVAAAGHPPRV